MNLVHRRGAPILQRPRQNEKNGLEPEGIENVTGHRGVVGQSVVEGDCYTPSRQVRLPMNESVGFLRSGHMEAAGQQFHLLPKLARRQWVNAWMVVLTRIANVVIVHEQKPTLKLPPCALCHEVSSAN